MRLGINFVSHVHSLRNCPNIAFEIDGHSDHVLSPFITVRVHREETENLAMKNLNGKVAVVTGSGSGIGRAVALELARQGCEVSLAGRTQGKLEETARQIGNSAKTSIFPLDVADRIRDCIGY